MARAGRARYRPGKVTKGLLLEAAYQMLAERGAGFSLRAVEEEAGVPHGQVSYHWGGLEGLRNAAIAHHATQSAMALERAAMHATTLGGTEAVEAIAEALLAGPANLTTDGHLRILAEAAGQAEDPILAHVLPGILQVGLGCSPAQAMTISWGWWAVLKRWLLDPARELGLADVRRLLVAIGSGVSARI